MEFNKIIGDTATSKLVCKVANLLEGTSLMFGGQQITTLNGLTKLWSHDIPTKAVASGTYKVLYAFNNQPKIFNEVVNQVALDLCVWCSVKNTKHNYGKKGKKETSLIWSTCSTPLCATNIEKTSGTES